MKKLSFILITLLSTFATKAQVKSFDYNFNTKIIYKYTYQHDSTNTDSRKELLTQLSIGEKASHFQAVGKFKSDSTASLSESNNFTHYNYGRINPNYFLIVKKEERIGTYEPINGVGLTGNSQLSYYEDNKEDLDWKIYPDTVRIDKFICQKATTTWAGRKWTAWFATDIPVSDGPYKFCGLPGLVLSISDQDKYFTFDLVSIQQIKETPIDLKKIRPDLVVQKTTKDNFYKERKAIRSNMIGYAAATGTNLKEENKQAVLLEAKEDNNHIEKY